MLKLLYNLTEKIINDNLAHKTSLKGKLYMVKLINGYAGTGKTTKLLQDVNNLLNNKLVSTNNILILTISSDEKTNLININNEYYNSRSLTIKSIDELCHYILNKSPKYFNNKTLTDFLAINIIGTICKSEFANNYSLSCLTKSITFFRELYNLFGILKNNNINYNQFIDVINSININETDKIRLDLIASVFNKYNKTLNNHNYLDFRDTTVAAIDILKENKIILDTIKSKFTHIFVDGFEDTTYLQFILIKLIANSEQLFIYGDEYSRIQEFRGAWRDNLSLNTMEKHFSNIELTNLDSTKRNNEILERALFLVKKYNNKMTSTKFKTTNKIKYIKFQDIYSEIRYITEDIINKINMENCKFGDFAVLIRDFESRQKFIDLFKTHEIPVNTQLYNENYLIFRNKLVRLLHMFNICEKLNVKEFEKEAFLNIQINSKVDLEIYLNELNLYIANIVSDVLEDNYLKDRFSAIQEEFNHPYLINVIYDNIEILKESDRNTLLKEFSLISNLYKLYKDNNIVELLIQCEKSQSNIFKDDEYNLILGKLLSDILSITDLYTTVIKEKPDLNTLISIINQPFAELSYLEDHINILTFFGSAGFEFKYVYIPCLTENNFPKKSKQLYFISPDTNDQVSSNLKKLNNNFLNLIEVDDDCIKEESRLFYIGMTRAKEGLLITTHNYEDKKQVPPSIFFQLLTDTDPENLVETIANHDNNLEINKLNNIKLDNIDEIPVIKENTEIKLSPSSIERFLFCPRKYFYTSLLNLKETSTFAADFGSIVHAIMEVFNATCLNKYDKYTLLNLANILLDSKINPEYALTTGFNNISIELVKATDSLKLAEIKEKFFSTVNDLDDKGFFISVPKKVITEKTFEFTIEESFSVIFNGRIDAIIKTDDGYSIIDYKTGKNKNKSLSYFLSDYGVNFQGDFGQYKGIFSENNIKNYEYQMPLYYLACQNAKELNEFKDKIKTLGLKYIRPTYLDNGYKEDMINSTDIEKQKDKIIYNLKETVINPILSETKFKQCNNEQSCQSCSFNFLCDKENEDDDN